MRPPALALFSSFVVAIALMVAVLTPVAASSRLVPVDPDYFAAPSHALVGAWMVTSEAGPMAFSFAPDGSLTVDYPLSVPTSNWTIASYGPAMGTWEAVGDQGVRFNAVQSITHVHGTDVGTVTIDGYAMLDARGLAAPATDLSAIITFRDAQNNMTSISSINGDLRSLIAAEPVAPTADLAVDPAISPIAGGCNTCR